MAEVTNLQNNADGSSGDTQGNGQGSEAKTGTESTTNSKIAEDKENHDAAQSKTLEELLGDEKLKAEYDARVAEAVDAAKNELQKEAGEAQKLAKMSEEERTAYDLQKQKDTLAQREADITRRELKLEAAGRLKKLNVPAELVELADLSSAEKCRASVNTISKVFNEAVQKAVDAKLHENIPAMKKAENQNSMTDEEKIRRAIRG